MGIKDLILEIIKNTDKLDEIQKKIFEREYKIEKREVSKEKTFAILPDGSKEEVTYIDGVKQGKAVNTKNNGERLEYFYKDGIISSEIIFYYKNGDREIFKIKNKKREGIAIYYFFNGDREEFIYSQGKKEGPAVYYSLNGKKEKYIYENNIKKELKLSTQEKKEINDIADEKEKNMVSWKTEYFSNGSKEEYQEVSGKKEGKAIYYWADGDKEKYTYKNGIKEGKAIFYHKEGSYEVYTYKNGEKQSDIEYFEKQEKNILLKENLISKDKNTLLANEIKENLPSKFKFNEKAFELYKIFDKYGVRKYFFTKGKQYLVDLGFEILD